MICGVRAIIAFLAWSSSFSSVCSAVDEVVFNLHKVLHHGIERNQKFLIQQSLPETIVQLEEKAIQIKTRPIQIQRLAERSPSTIEPILLAARQHGIRDTQEWVIDTVDAPDVTDRDTIINLALIAANAYTLVPGTEDWEDLDKQFGFNTSLDFGWNANGLRGHVYADATNSTVIIGIKGTSRALYDGEETTTADKENDNLYFSCCCAQQGQWTYLQVCDCATSTYNCNSTCLDQNLREDHRYYQAARYLYANVTEMYPNASVWVTGHSLGGSISSLLGLTYGLPAIAFEAPPEALPASRLGIPKPPDTTYAREMTGTYHFGHTADPIYMGTCNGYTASCSYYGYAFETQCHAGMTCTYDTVLDKGWRVNILTHGIRDVIKDVLRAYDTVPSCVLDDQCEDCYLWKFFHSNSSVTTTTTFTSTTTSSSRSRTRTVTCETPGWWGCRDESSTSSSSSSTAIITSKTTTTTSTSISTTSTTSSSSTSTCKTPGWFWCKDKPATTLTTTTTTKSSTTISQESSTLADRTGPANAIPTITLAPPLPTLGREVDPGGEDQNHEL